MKKKLSLFFNRSEKIIKYRYLLKNTGLVFGYSFRGYTNEKVKLQIKFIEMVFRARHCEEKVYNSRSGCMKFMENFLMDTKPTVACGPRLNVSLSPILYALCIRFSR